jgi:acyl-CoA hydrolase
MGYDRHKIFIYKEDFNKFVKGLNEAVDYVKTELMPDFDFDAFNHDTPEGEHAEGGYVANSAPVDETAAAAEKAEEVVTNVTQSIPEAENPAVPSASTGDNGAHEEVDKW